MLLPEPIGPHSESIVDLLRYGSHHPWPARESVSWPAGDDALTDADLQWALFLCYELHFRGFDDVPDEAEWDPRVLTVRAELESAFRTALERAVPRPEPHPAGDVPAALAELIRSAEGPSLSSYLLRAATVDQYRDFLRQRSIYHLREADGHTFGIPRITGRAKAALVEIQADEYGNGRPERMHSHLFANTLRALGLDDGYGSHWKDALPETLATVNLMSLFGLHRRWRGALLGHLAVLEMDSTRPNHRYGNGLRRLGFGPSATHFFDEHVEADAVHEQLAAVDMCGSFAVAEPDLIGDLLWGAACCLALDALAGNALLSRWRGIAA